MTRKEQIRFLRELSKNIVDDLVRAVKSGVIPEDWDGHELRVLLADRFGESADMSAIRREPRCARARDYRNWRLINPRV